MTTLVLLPINVLLQICGHLELDSFSLPPVCRSLYDLSCTRIFWITILSFARATRQLPCAMTEDLSLLDLTTLRKRALHARRLQDNWSSDNPKLLGGWTTMSLPTSSRHNTILFHVPGARLVVVQYWISMDSIMIACINIGENKVLSQLPLEGVRALDWISRPCYEGNRCSIALHYERFISVIELEHSTDGATLRKALVANIPDDDDSSTGSLGLNATLLARVYTSPDRRLRLMVTVLSTAQQTTLDLKLPDPDSTQNPVDLGADGKRLFIAIHFSSSYIKVLADMPSCSFGYCIPYELSQTTQTLTFTCSVPALPTHIWNRPQEDGRWERTFAYRCTVVTLAPLTLCTFTVPSLRIGEPPLQPCMDVWDMAFAANDKTTRKFEPTTYMISPMLEGRRQGADPRAAVIYSNGSCTLLTAGWDEDVSQHRLLISKLYLGEGTEKSTETLERCHDIELPPGLDPRCIEDVSMETGWGIICLIELSGKIWQLSYA